MANLRFSSIRSCAINHAVRLFVLTILCFNLTACIVPTYEGYSPIRHGIVQAYKIEEVNGVSRISSTKVGEQIETDEEGFFTLILPRYTDIKKIVVKVSATATSTYSCMLVDNCEPENLAEGFSLLGTLPDLIIGETPKFSIGVLSHLVVSQASLSPSGLTREAIEAAQHDVESLFKLSPENIFNSHIALTALTESTQSLEGLEGSLKAILLEMAFVVMAASPPWYGIAGLLEQVPGIEKGDLYRYASEQAEVLSKNEQNMERLDVLLDVVGHFNSSHNPSMEEGANIEPLAILLQPMPQTVKASQSASFRVTTMGEGLINYQWYKDNRAIVGAVGPSLMIDNVTLLDEGSYHVVVTNQSQTQSSRSAKLTVTNEVSSTPKDSGSATPVRQPLVLNFPKIDITQYYTKKEVLESPASGSDEHVVDNSDSSENELEETPVVEGNVDDVVENVVEDVVEGIPSDDSVDNDMSSLPETDSETVRTVSINWSPPSSKTSGEALNLWEIEGYKLIYGHEPDALDSSILISGALKLTYRVEDLIPDSYYFAVATITTEGIQGPYSEIIHVDLR